MRWMEVREEIFRPVMEIKQTGGKKKKRSMSEGR